jgi:hypothetical protein
LEELQDLAHDPISNGEEVTLGGAVADSDLPSLNMHEEMAAIPEIETPGRRSKRRAGSVDESSLERAERMKVARNLDFKGFFSEARIGFSFGLQWNGIGGAHNAISKDGDNCHVDFHQRI